jgi:hypothetical protein
MRMAASLLNLALNMDERCKIIQELGGTFYLDRDACEESATTAGSRYISMRHEHIGTS